MEDIIYIFAAVCGVVEIAISFLLIRHLIAFITQLSLESAEAHRAFIASIKSHSVQEVAEDEG